MWKKAYLESRILSADPIELIQILYEHAILTVGEARASLAVGDIAARSKAISRTIEILAELEGSLNHEAGGSISRNLGELYQYMRMRLTTANVKKEDAPLAEVESLLNTLAEAWNAIRPGASAAPAAEEEAAAAGQWSREFAREPEIESAAHNWSA